MITSHGEYYVLCAPDGALTDDAFTVLRDAARTGASLIYGDELTIGADGTERPVKKPEPSPDTLLSYNYIGSPVAVSRALMETVGPPASASYEERWSFTLNAFFSADFVLHVPRVLFCGKAEKRKADTALVQHALKRLSRAGQALVARASGCVSVRYAYPPDTLLSVIIAARGSAEALRDTLASLELWNTSVRTEYIVIDGSAPSERNEAYYHALEGCGVKVLRRWYDHNLAHLYNVAATQALGEALLFLRAGERVRSSDALSAMLAFAMQPHIGAVGAWTVTPPFEEAYVRNVRLIMHAPMLSHDMFTKAAGFDESLATGSCIAALSIVLKELRTQLVQTPDAVIEAVQESGQPDERTALRCRDLSI